jgi:ArsR family transcriptional regulator, arsenate/arsenite/antimonite-responsive transcriptional repressor
MSALLKAIADPVRLRLVSLIASHQGGEACVCELTGAFELTPPTISHHLKILREAGLIGSERRATWVYYRINPHVLARLSALLSPDAMGLAVRG